MGVEASIRHELKNQQKLALLMAPPDELHQVSVHKYKTAYDPNFIDKNSLWIFKVSENPFHSNNPSQTTQKPFVNLSRATSSKPYIIREPFGSYN